MAPWEPSPIWEGEDCYIIGGGPSLRGFEWDLLKDLHTIGCNTAFQLGPEVCSVCAYGDDVFYAHHYKELEQFEGPVVTNVPSMLRRDDAPSYIKAMRRKPKGLWHGDTLGWNSSTGAMAINLALSFGASRVFLLGFDMATHKGEPNWHPNPINTRPQNSVYDRFLRGMGHVARDLESKFPDRQVVNLVGHLGSRLEVFLRAPLEEHEALRGLATWQE